MMAVIHERNILWLFRTCLERCLYDAILNYATHLLDMKSVCI